MEKSNFFIVLLVVAFLLFAPVHSIAQTIINFDTDPNNNPIPDNTVINSTYNPLDVTFSCRGTCPFGNNVYAVSYPAYATSDSNVVSFLSYTPVVYSNEGVVRATFNCPGGVSSVSIRAIAYYNNSAAKLVAFDSGDTMITTSVDFMANQYQTTELIINADKIAYVEFAGLQGGPDNYQGSVFDDLQFTCPARPVPGTNQWGMMLFLILAGLGGVYYLYDRKKNTVEN